MRFVVRRGAEVATGACAPGERLLDALDDAGVSAELALFSCRGASCGVCLSIVRGGVELLEPARDEERAALETLATEQDRTEDARLLCQVVALGDGVSSLGDERAVVEIDVLGRRA